MFDESFKEPAKRHYNSLLSPFLELTLPRLLSAGTLPLRELTGLHACLYCDTDI